MVYPDTAEGFLVHDQKKWTEFKKEEVRGQPCHKTEQRTDELLVPFEDLRGPRHRHCN